MTLHFDAATDQFTLSLSKGDCEQKRAYNMGELRAFLMRNYYHLVVAHHIGTVDVKEGLKWTFDWGNIYSKCVSLWIPMEEFLHSQNPQWMGKATPKRPTLFD